MISLTDTTKEEAMPLCTCGSKNKAILYCNKGCNPDSFYYCFLCGSIHDHRTILVSTATTENINMCFNMRQEVNELN